MALAPAEPLIDLGELTDRVPPDPLDRRGPGGPPLGLRVVAVLVLVAALLVADRAPVRLRSMVTTTSAPANFQLAGDTLYVFDGAYAPNRVTAYRLTDGHRMWEVGSPPNVAYDNVTRVGDVTFLVPNPCIAARPVHTIAL